MKAVNDRIVQYPNRYQLVNVETGEVLGTYDFVEVTGTVQQAGTEIDKELFDSIQADLNTKADQDGTYTDLTAGKSNALTTAVMTASDDLNNFYGEDYWGKMFYCGGGEEPSHSPSGASGGSVFIYRNGTGSTVQEYTSNVARSGSNLPTKWHRARAYSGTWNAWEEVVTSTGDYADLSVGEATKATQDANGNVINTTYATKAEANAKYTKPASGIPETDLAADVQTSLEKADSAYQKPSNGIPETDLTDTAQESLDKADTAYQKPSTGIPKADLSEEVQNALETAVQGAPDATTTVKGIMTLGADGGAARYGEKSDVGLENVDNVKQYSESNPPPYPVYSVAGKTGIVTLSKGDVYLGNVDNTADIDKPVSTAQAEAINAKYTKPASGIPESDLTADVQESLGRADTAYQKPTSGIPETDLATDVQDKMLPDFPTQGVDIMLRATRGSLSEEFTKKWSYIGKKYTHIITVRPNDSTYEKAFCGTLIIPNVRDSTPLTTWANIYDCAREEHTSGRRTYLPCFGRYYDNEWKTVVLMNTTGVDNSFWLTFSDNTGVTWGASGGDGNGFKIDDSVISIIEF